MLQRVPMHRLALALSVATTIGFAGHQALANVSSTPGSEFRYYNSPTAGSNHLFDGHDGQGTNDTGVTEDVIGQIAAWSNNLVFVSTICPNGGNRVQFQLLLTDVFGNAILVQNGSGACFNQWFTSTLGAPGPEIAATALSVRILSLPPNATIGLAAQ